MAVIDDFDEEEERKRRSAAGGLEFTRDTIAADPWSAIYLGIPAGIDPELLKYAMDTAMRCAGAVCDVPPAPTHPFAPTELGADKTQAENFANAVRHIDDLNDRRREVELAELRDTVQAQIEAADRVVDNWSSGDLAGAVNGLEETAEAARATLRALSPEPDVSLEPDLFAKPPQQELLAPQWREVDNEWHMLIGNESVAKLTPNSDAERFPQYKWVSLITTDDYPDHGWHAVDFETLAVGQSDLEQWWHHARQGEAYDPEEPAAARLAEPEAPAIDPWIMTISEGLSLSNDAQLEATRLLSEFERLDWWHDYSDDYEVRGRERQRVYEARQHLDEFATASPDHAEIASRIFDRTAPPEFVPPLADWYASESLAERVQRIIEHPELEIAEQDERVLDALAERREELGLAEPARRDDDDDREAVYSADEPVQTQSSAGRDAAEIDYLFGREEMTEAKQEKYDRFTGQEIGARSGQDAAQVQDPAQSQSQGRGRSR
jgi:hypothetical protein